MNELEETRLGAGVDAATKADQEWRESFSGILFERIQAIAQREGKEAEIQDKMRMVETFCVGDERAKLYHRLQGGGVGESGGTIGNLIEAYDYRKLSWWKEAFDQGGLEFRFMELPLVFLAKDAGVLDPNIFRPTAVLAKYQFDPGNDSTSHLSDWVASEIIKVLTPKLVPDYQIRIADSALRLVPLTAEAEQARTINNTVYAKALQAIFEASGELDVLFQQKAASLREEMAKEVPEIS